MDQSRSILGRKHDTQGVNRQGKEEPKAGPSSLANNGSGDEKPKTPGDPLESFHGVNQGETILGRKSEQHQPKNPGPPLNDSDLYVAEEASAIPRMENPLLFSWIRQIGWASIGFAALFVLCLLIFLITETASLIATFQYFPVFIQAIYWISLVALWSVAIVSAGTVVNVFLKLRPSPKVSMDMLETLDQRDRTDLTKAIRDFLRSYPRDKGQEQLLLSAGFAKSDSSSVSHVSIDKLFASCDDLLQEQYGTIHDELTQIDESFLQHLDSAVDNIIRRSWKHVGVRTILFPRGLFDSLIILIAAWTLTRDICRVYGLRPSAWDTSALLFHVVAQALVAQQLGDSEWMEDEIAESAAAVLGQAVANIVGKMGGKLAEGTVNAILIRRLGYRVQAVVRPISSDQA
ncbi:MAG: YcjF family protein [Pirellulales bacterium]